MVWDSALGSIIEVAIALAGFSGIVAAVGRRGVGQWSSADQLLLRVLLMSSGMAILFAFLPYILIDLLEPSVVWRSLSSVLALWLSALAIIRMRQGAALGIRRVYGLHYLYFAGLSVTIISLLVFNAVWLGSSSLYLVGVLWQVTISFVTFVTLLLNSWREGPAETARAQTSPTTAATPPAD
jgi:hypothetical protein